MWMILLDLHVPTGLNHADRSSGGIILLNVYANRDIVPIPSKVDRNSSIEFHEQFLTPIIKEEALRLRM